MSYLKDMWPFGNLLYCGDFSEPANAGFKDRNTDIGLQGPGQKEQDVCLAPVLGTIEEVWPSAFYQNVLAYFCVPLRNIPWV